MVLRKTGLDELPLLVVLGASASLVAWAFVGASDTVNATPSADQVRHGNSVRAQLNFDASPTDALAWSELARGLMQESSEQLSPTERTELGPTRVAALATLDDPGARLVPKLADADADEVKRITCVDEFSRPLLHGWALGDQPHGRWVVWNGDGGRLFSGRFEVGVPEGAWTAWHENGELRSEGYFEHGSAQGLWREFHLNGREASLLEYHDGVLHGQADEWWDNGSTRTDGQYAEGERDGPWLTWHQNGQLRARGTYRAGLREDAWEEWHDNGHLMQQAHYRRGRPHGPWNEWYRDGSAKTQGVYVDGRREGAWTFLNFDGTSDPRTGEYDDGRRVR